LSISRSTARPSARFTLTSVSSTRSPSIAGAPPDLLGPEDIRGWLYHLIAERKQAVSTINLAINAVRSFYGGLLQRNIEPLLHQIKRPRRTALATSPLRFAPAPTPRPAPPPLTCPHCQGTEVCCIGRVERSGKITFFARAWLCGRAPAYTDTS
jgi:hypothetical protein